MYFLYLRLISMTILVAGRASNGLTSPNTGRFARSRTTLTVQGPTSEAYHPTSTAHQVLQVSYETISLKIPMESGSTRLYPQAKIQLASVSK